MGKYSKKNNKTKRHNTTIKNTGFKLNDLHAALDVAALEPTEAQQTLNHELKAAPKKSVITKRRHSHGGYKRSTKKNKSKSKRRTTRKY